MKPVYIALGAGLVSFGILGSSVEPKILAELNRNELMEDARVRNERLVRMATVAAAIGIGVAYAAAVERKTEAVKLAHKVNSIGHMAMDNQNNALAIIEELGAIKELLRAKQ